MNKDPICGMKVDPEKAKSKGLVSGNTYFCSENCLKKFKGGKTEILLSSLLIIVSIIVYYYGLMLPFMGLVFLLLAGLKLVDVKGFSKMFSQYDILASRSKIYSLVYPFIELILGLMYLFKFKIIYAAGITIFVMSFGAVGVARNLMSKNKIRCACLGTKIKVPLTRFTLVEDIIMLIMAIMLMLS